MSNWTSTEDGGGGGGGGGGGAKGVDGEEWSGAHEATRNERRSQALLHLGVGELDALLDAALELRQRLLHQLLLVLTQLAESAEALDAVALHAHAEPSSSSLRDTDIIT